MLQLALAVNTLFKIYEVIVLVWCILSWIPMTPGGFLYDLNQVVGRLVEPYVNIFRRFIPPMGGIDFSALVAILVLGFLRPFVIRLILAL